jgi:hypothetical protein
MQNNALHVASHTSKVGLLRTRGPLRVTFTDTTLLELALTCVGREEPMGRNMAASVAVGEY